ncbi:ATP-binding protein [Geodermatophilus sp. SYSU D01180]
MTTATTSRWTEANQAYLSSALHRLGRVVGGGADAVAASPDLDELAREMPRPPALQALASAFGLSAFERDVLLMCAGVELDAEFVDALRRAGAGGQPTFGTALALLPDAHWSALAPSAPLRRWRLVEPAPGGLLSQAPLRAAERVVHFLAGVQTLAPEIDGVVDVLQRPAERFELAPSHALLAERAIRAFTATVPLGRMPLVQLTGRDDGARDVAAAVAAGLGLGLAVLHADDVPAGAPEREQLARLWEREAVLSDLLLVVDASTVGDEPPAVAGVVRLLDLLASPTLVLARRPLPGLRREDVRLVVEPPPLPERLAAWRAVLPDPEPDLGIERIAGQFTLTGRDVRAVLGELALRDPVDAADAGRILWDLCRERSRPRLGHLAEHLPDSTAWADLVLPRQQKQALREIATHARVRHRVYGSWGFAEKTRRGLGISVLFAGPSGTGKTMAAEALAELLRLDLYRIDLSRVVSKYIGETERNLGRIFDEAEAAGGVVLLFDEADALFGKRTEVRDSHDRYANLEVSYLLQRMEAYEGLAILTTNLKSSLDPAFLRRIRFVVGFPFPDAAARALIWREAFPAATPTEGLAFDKLARLSVAGGTIRNIALNAAFAAAESGEPVRMAHVLAAARSEYTKLERSLPDAEIRGWT